MVCQNKFLPKTCFKLKSFDQVYDVMHQLHLLRGILSVSFNLLHVISGIKKMEAMYLPLVTCAQ